MDAPEIVEEALDGEDVATRVDLGGDDELYVTATRTLIYRGEGLLSDESVEAYAHDAERVTVSEGRRKTRLTLTYPIEGEDDFTLPAGSADAAIPPILAGVLNANGVIEPGETVLETFLFSELTLVLTENRLVKHIGEAVWDEEFEEYAFADVTGVDEEAGSVATQIVLTVDGRSERIKTPNDRAAEVRKRLEEAIRAYHDLGPNEDVTAALSPADDEDGEAGAGEQEATTGAMSFEDGIAPLSAGDTSETSSDPDPAELRGGDGPAAAGSEAASADAGGAGAEPTANGSRTDEAASDPGGSADDRTPSPADDRTGAAGDDGTDSSADDPAGTGANPEAAAAPDPAADGDAATAADDAFEEAGFEPAGDESSAVAEEVAELRSAVEKQNRLLAKQQRTIEQLIEELRRGR